MTQRMKAKKEPNTNAVDTYTVGNEEQKKMWTATKNQRKPWKMRNNERHWAQREKNRVVDIEKMLPQTDVGVSE